MEIKLTKKEISYILLGLNCLVLEGRVSGKHNMEVSVLLSRLIDCYNSIQGTNYLEEMIK